MFALWAHQTQWKTVNGLVGSLMANRMGLNTSRGAKVFTLILEAQGYLGPSSLLDSFLQASLVRWNSRKIGATA